MGNRGAYFLRSVTSSAWPYGAKYESPEALRPVLAHARPLDEQEKQAARQPKDRDACRELNEQIRVRALYRWRDKADAYEPHPHIKNGIVQKINCVTHAAYGVDPGVR